MKHDTLLRSMVWSTKRVDTLSFQNIRYLKSAAELNQLPTDEGAEVAFIGRSNAGKSSALNTLTGVKGLARTSKTPGRTQMINFFALDQHKRLVDLPGYGYAQVPLSVRQLWLENVAHFLEHRKCLKGLILVMDIRHPLKEIDQKMIAWCDQYTIPCHVLLTKADKLTPHGQRKVCREVSEQLAPQKTISVQLFSSMERLGVDKVQSVLNMWLIGES